MRIGFGYDAHKLVTGRRLILGGVPIDFPKGLLGHSDADVLLHALVDALLGAAGLGDIGKHFPPIDDAYKDISSVTLLERAACSIKEKGYSIVNVDSSIVCEAPRLASYIPKMTEITAKALGCAVDCVNIKATTEEGLGFTGSGEGISAYAVALLSKKG
ncbi:MAG: 2-C-methyl-D-erythritol 2,4-cyclodiphosphate synthase [Thermodesulfobacteriota bacterium]